MRCLPTPRAVEVLGRSKLTLLRYARDGHLTPGMHFFRGPYQARAGEAAMPVATLTSLLRDADFVLHEVSAAERSGMGCIVICDLPDIDAIPSADGYREGATKQLKLGGLGRC